MGALHGNNRPDADATGAAASGSRSPEAPAPDHDVNGSAGRDGSGSADRGVNGRVDPGADGSADRGADGRAGPGIDDSADRCADGRADPGADGSADRGADARVDPRADDSVDRGADGRADPGTDRGASAGPTDVAAAPEPQRPAEPEWPTTTAPQYAAQYPPPGPPYPPGQQYPPQYSGQYPVQYSGQYPPGPYPGPYTSPPPQPRGLRAWGAPAPERTHRWGLGAYVLAEAVFLVVGGLFSLSLILSGTEPTIGLIVVGMAAPTVLAAGTALLITRVRGNGPRVDLRLEWSWRDVGLGLAFGFGGLALTIPASVVYVAIVGQDASSAVGDVFGGLRADPVMAVLVLLIVVVIAPMCEEILYRGLLWGGVERLGGRWVAFGVTTVLFAIAHFEFTRTPLLLVVAIPIAIARLYTGKLLPAIVAHQINNLLPGIVLLLGLLGVVPMA